MTERAEEIAYLKQEIEDLENDIDYLMNDLIKAKGTERYEIEAEIKDQENIRDEKEREILDLGEICERCQGEGEILDRGRINSRTISPPYCRCPDCDGEGVI